MVLDEDLGVFATFELQRIKRKLMHAHAGEGWDEARTNDVEQEYRRFLYLTKEFPEQLLAPSQDVDTFWHYHILDTAKYAHDCKELFGNFLHHYPYLGLEDDDTERDEADSKMRSLYESTFARKGSSGEAAYCAAGARTAYCAAGSKTVYRAASTETAYCATGMKIRYCATGAKTSYCAVGARTSERQQDQATA